MGVRFYYQDFDKTENTDAYLRAQIQGVVDKSIKDGKYSLFIRSSSVSDAEKAKGPFMCEVRLDLPNSAPLFLKKQGEDFYQTVKGLSESLNNAVERIVGVREPAHLLVSSRVS